jgi:hypothetical protein
MKKIFLFLVLTMILYSCNCSDKAMFSELKNPIMVINKQPWKQGVTEGEITVRDVNGKILTLKKHYKREDIGDILFKNFEVGDIINFNKLKK